MLKIEKTVTASPEQWERLVKDGNINPSRRMIPVYMTVTAPLYFWKEFDTYKVDTVRNSCLTAHKITEKGFTIEDFSVERLFSFNEEIPDIVPVPRIKRYNDSYDPSDVLLMTIDILNEVREAYLNCVYGPVKKEIWYNLVQLLPSSYNQKATLMLNYEVLHKIYVDKKSHKLDEWRTFCNWIKTLPYAELIVGED